MPQLKPTLPHNWSLMRFWHSLQMRLVPERRLRWDRSAFDAQTRSTLASMRAEKSKWDDIEAFQNERSFLREELSGAIYERESEALKAEARKLNVYVKSLYEGEDEDIYDQNQFGFKWLRDPERLRRALLAARKEAKKEAREWWGWIVNLVIGVAGVLIALLGTLLSSKAAIIEIVKEVSRTWGEYCKS